jgi:hypothetical protein
MYAPITGTGDGTAPVVNLTFDYLSRDHVKASVDGVEVAFTWTGLSQITFSAVVSALSTWKVYRQTPVDPMVDFTNGSVLTEDELDIAARQPLYRQAEIEDVVEAASTAANNATAAAAAADTAAAAAQAAVDQINGAGGAHRLTYGVKTPFRTIRQAREFFPTLHTEIVGFAAHPVTGAAITGGYGQTEYYVDSASLDPGQENSFGWAIAKAKAGTGGFIYFDPRGQFDILLQDDDTTLRFNPGDDNITIYAPGLNVTIWTTPLTGGVVLMNDNMIWRGIYFRTMSGPMSGDWDGINVKVEHKLVSVIPESIGRIAFDMCEFRHASDGALDMSSSTFDGADGLDHHVTVQRSIFWDTDETNLIGSNIPASNLLTSPTHLWVTFWKNIWAYTGQRNPKVLGRTFVHMVDNYQLLVPWQRDNPSPTLEFGALYGVGVAQGGKALIEGALFTAPLGTVANVTQLITDAGSPTTGALKVTDVTAEGSLTVTTGNEASVPDPTLHYTLAHTVVPAAGTPRENYITALWQTAGARPEAAPDGVFVFSSSSTAYPNGETVLLDRATPGRWLRTDIRVEFPEKDIQRSGVYTPTPDPASYVNVNTLTFHEASWVRHENGYITVEGALDLASTASGDVQFKVSLPVPSALTQTYHAFGSLVAFHSTGIAGGGIDATTSGGKVWFRPNTGTTSSQQFSYRFTYKVL